MAAKVIRAIPKQQYDYTTTMDAANKVSFWAATHVEVSQYKEVTLVARLHEWDTSNAQQIDIALYNDGCTDEDPKSSFFEDLGQGKSLNFTETTDGAPYLKMAVATSADDAVAANVAVKVTLTQGSNAADCSVVVSADLILRD